MTWNSSRKRSTRNESDSVNENRCDALRTVVIASSKGFVGVDLIPEIPLDVGHLGRGENISVHIRHPETAGGTEVGTHGAFSVGRDVDQAPTGRGRIGGRLGGRKGHADVGEIVSEHMTQLVVAHLAEKCRRRTEHRRDHCCVGR